MVRHCASMHKHTNSKLYLVFLFRLVYKEKLFSFCCLICIAYIFTRVNGRYAKKNSRGKRFLKGLLLESERIESELKWSIKRYLSRQYKWCTKIWIFVSNKNYGASVFQ